MFLFLILINTIYYRAASTRGKLYIAPRSPDVTLPLLSGQNYNRDNQEFETVYESDNSNTIVISSDSSDNEENQILNVSTDQTNIQETNSVREFSTNTLRPQQFNANVANVLRQHESNTQRNSNMEFSANRSQAIDTLGLQQSNSDILRPNDINLNRSRSQASSSTHQPSESLLNNDNQFDVNDSTLILNTKEFRIQHLNSLRTAYGINNHETIRITINDRSSITDHLLNWIYSAEVRDLIKEPFIEITSEK